MSPEEYIGLTDKFVEELRKQLKEKQDIDIQVVGDIMFPGMRQTTILIMNELYEVFNTGNRAWWEFRGTLA